LPTHTVKVLSVNGRKPIVKQVKVRVSGRSATPVARTLAPNMKIKKENSNAPEHRGD
jgi:hypothetical protein